MLGVLYGLFFLSGAAALVYQVAWQRSLSLVFGGSHLAVSTVLAVFMGGMALGSALLGKRADASRRPLRLYGMLEIGIALSAAAFLGIMKVYPAVYGPLARLAHDDRTSLTVVRVLLTTAALIVPTTLMGGTLPVLSRLVARRRDSLGSHLSLLYAFNTLGATAGALATGFFLLKTFGVTAAVCIAISVNLAVGLAALLIPGRAFEGAEPSAGRVRDEPPPSAERVSPLSFRLVLWGIGVSGFCALGYEVLWTRTLTLVVGTSVYGFTLMLAAFLTGIALGSGLYGAWHRRRAGRHPNRTVLAFGLVQIAIGASAVAVTALMGHLPAHAVRLQHAFSGVAETEFAIRQAASATVAFGYMLVPALLMGAAFPLAGTIHAAYRSQVGRAVGEVLTANTVGAILGSVVSGFVLIYVFGIERSLQLLAAINVAAGVIVAASLTRRRVLWATAAASAAGVVLVAANPSWGRTWDVKRLAIFRNTDREGFLDPRVVDRYLEEEEVLYQFEGINETINVIRSKSGRQEFGVNGRTEASNLPADVQCQLALGHLPMLLHPNPRNVFVLGSGAGMTLGATSVHPEAKRITLAEIEPGVLPATRTFARWNHGVLDDPKLRIVFNDGRNYLATTPEKFDVITADPIHPWSGGASYLYTREYFRSVAEHLAPGGIACQWLPIYELRPHDVKTVLRTFAESFPHVLIWLTHYDAEIVASNAPIVVDEAALERRIAATPAVREDLESVEMGTAERLLSYFVLGAEGVRAYSRDGLVNTDDNLHLEFSSPEAMGIGELMGVNVGEITSLRDSILPYLAPPTGGESVEQQRARWERNAAAARLVDRLHVLSLWGAMDAPEFQALRGVLSQAYPRHPRFRFLDARYQEHVDGEPRLVDRVECRVAGRDGSRGTLRIAAVTRLVTRLSDTEHRGLFLVDEDAQEFLGRTYFDGPGVTVTSQVKTAAGRALSAAQRACADAQTAQRGGGPLPARAETKARVAAAIAGAIGSAAR